MSSKFIVLIKNLYDPMIYKMLCYLVIKPVLGYIVY